MGKKAIAMFVDLRAADMVDRDVLGRAMRKRRIREGLVVKVKETLRKNRVTEEETGESFWIAKEVKQDCLLNPIFSIC